MLGEIMLMIFGLCLGMMIGLFIDTRLNNNINKSNKMIIKKLEKFIKSQEEVIDLYDMYYKDLEKAYENCQEGITETINENIELRRRLSHE